MLNGTTISLPGSTLLELGGGTGFLAMGLASRESGVGVSTIYVTEGETEVYDNLCFNVQENGCQSFVRPVFWDWEEMRDVPPDIPVGDVDLVIGSDLVYVGSGEKELATAIGALLRHEKAKVGLCALIMLTIRPPGGEQFLPLCRRPDSNTRAVDRFTDACALESLKVTEIQLASEKVLAGLGDKARLPQHESLGLYQISCLQMEN